MANFSNSFMEYLKIYNPAAFAKANSEDAKPEELTSIYNANVAKYVNSLTRHSLKQKIA